MMRQLLLVLALLTAAFVPLAAGQGTVMPVPRIQFLDNSGNPLSGGKLYSYASGTTTPQSTYTTNDLSVANANPVILDSAGRATVFLSATLSYKFTLTNSVNDAVWSVDGITGQFSGVITINAADTRALRISRGAGDAGMSIQSGAKTYGYVTTTGGSLQIRDDSDGTPQMAFIGDNITHTLAGTFTVDGGLLSVTGFGDHVFAASGNGPNRLGIRNTSAGTAAVSSLMLGNDAAVNSGALFALSTGYTTSGSYVADGVSLEATRAGGLSINASNAAGDIRIYSAGALRMTVLDTGAVTHTGRYESATLQPGFYAYNSSTDAGVITGATIDFDTEEYDSASNFAADVFTAPVTGIYQFCSTVLFAANGGSQATFVFRRSDGAEFYFAYHDALTVGSGSGCALISVTAAQTVHVKGYTGNATFTITGGTRVSSFSGRLMP